MGHFDLKQYLKEGKLYKENFGENEVINFLTHELEVYLEGDMDASAPNSFILEQDEYTPELVGEKSSSLFNQAVDYLQKEGDTQFSSDYGYKAVASLDGGDINIRFKEEPQF